MIVYGDAVRCAPAAVLLAEAAELTARTSAAQGAARRELAVELLILLGSVAQAVLDQEFAEKRVDEEGPLVHVCALLCRAGACALLAAHGQRSDDWGERVAGALCQLSLLLPPDRTLLLREPEGYAHYSLYPQQYWRAAEACAAESNGDWCVIGLRSIGTSLGAVVSEVLQASRFVTLRPVGHPYARRVAIGQKLEAALRARAQGRFAIVDEGPGRSGSSFAAVFDWLRARGVNGAQIHFFPGHMEAPGPHVDAGFRAAYAAAPRHHVSFDRALLHDGSRTLVGWFEAELGELVQAVEDISGGAWRALRYPAPSAYPPSHVCGEARKLVLTTRSGHWLVKQLGLGARARECGLLKRRLGQVGLAPRLYAMRHGFILQRWHAEATPLRALPGEREALLQTLTKYLTLLARDYPAGADVGARPAALLAMLRINVQELCGGQGAHDDALARLGAGTSALEDEWRPMISDNRLDVHEWLVLPGGAILKADAVEHSRAHDLVGRQDPAWDVAGAKVELGLSDPELEHLLRALRDGAGRSLSPRALQFYELAYLAFRAGQAALQCFAMRERWPDDAERMARARDRYADRLSALLC